MNSIVDEFSRLQTTFSVLINQLNQSDTPQRETDEEANATVPQMPGAIDFNEHIPSVNNTNNSIFSSIISVLITTILLLLIFPLYIIYKILIHSFFIIASVSLKFQKLKYKSLRSNDPVDVSKRFIRTFDERIGNNTKTVIRELDRADSSVIEESGQTEIPRPDFLECAYSHAMLIVKNDVRWLLCYVESSENPDSVRFTNEVLINSKFLNFIRKRKILIWGGDISDSEAFITCNQFKITKLPFLGLLFSKIQGYRDLDYVLQKFDKAYRRYNPTVMRLQNFSHNGNFMTVINREHEEDDADYSENHIIHEETYNQEEELRYQWLRWRKSRLLPVHNIAGEFECNMLNDVDIEAGVEYERPMGYNHEFRFNIYTVFPREYIPCDSTKTIEETAMIFPSENLIVEVS
ncbi:hypothetical protein CANINC_001647 [Pichia inconspicua]|uniref:UAS domain-containing protein n=1 Tax=Pichia inconspicua TaxID=52247 RepID=A0A4T0X349_9ASCO|nr:hypothetical protein CANINC_001647 [[Candida] inconspicua]